MAMTPEQLAKATRDYAAFANTGANLKNGGPANMFGMEVAPRNEENPVLKAAGVTLGMPS